MSEKQKFIEAIAEHAQEVQRQYGVPASIVIAQAALETGWGKSVRGYNLFGIKKGSTWIGATQEFTTHEVINGVRVKVSDTFRAYTSIREVMQNYGQLLSGSSRYARAMNAANPHAMADELEKAGYATDEEYSEKLKSIISSNNLTRFDDNSFSGYTDHARFQAVRGKLRQQRDGKPEVWTTLINQIGLIIESIVVGIGTLLTGGSQVVASRDANDGVSTNSPHLGSRRELSPA
jgi:hypothetical protein